MLALARSSPGENTLYAYILVDSLPVNARSLPYEPPVLAFGTRHKDSIDVATGEERGGEVRHYGAIGGDLAAVTRLARKLESSANGPLVFVYEAGPCGFGIYRLLRARGHDCWVVSPGLTPRSNADRVKTDRRDCLKLARLARAGELVPIHVPDQIDEAMRDLVRAREDAVIGQRQVRQRLAALLLRNDLRYAGKTAWTPAHRRRNRGVQTPPAGEATGLRGVRAGGRGGRAAHRIAPNATSRSRCPCRSRFVPHREQTPEAARPAGAPRSRFASPFAPVLPLTLSSGAGQLQGRSI
jgi:hypothetical protein